ncbi:MAG: hypothetical protein ACLVEU_17250 [Bacteroides cellulosilyticus]
MTYQLTRLYPYSGKVIYTREINIPESFRGKKLFLMMERTKPSTVWVDGDSIGSCHLYAPHRYELPALAVGKHQLKIRIDNSPTSVPKRNTGLSCLDRCYANGNWNGILGGVHIEAVPVFLHPVGTGISGSG